MKKRTYKRLQKRLYREIKARKLAEDDRDCAQAHSQWVESEIKRLRKRFAEFGTNVSPIPFKNGNLRCVEWQISPCAYGNYVMLMDDIQADEQRFIKEELTKALVRGLIENNTVQFIYTPACNQSMPLEYGTLSAKLYVVPWEQVPHRDVIKIRQLAKDITDDEKEKWGYLQGAE